MVRLEVVVFIIRPSCGNLFQFLYGAIGSAPCSVSLVNCSSFNSYMVRLEGFLQVAYVRLTQVSIPIWCDWKKNLSSPLDAFRCFNSYMVRLEATVVDFSFVKTEFQFLYGAIGRILDTI